MVPRGLDWYSCRLVTVADIGCTTVPTVESQPLRTALRAPPFTGCSRRCAALSDRSDARGARCFCDPRPRRCARRFCARWYARKCVAQRRSDRPDPSFRTALWLAGARQRRVFSARLCSICGRAIAAQHLCINMERDRSAVVRTGARHRLCRQVYGTRFA